MTRHAASTPSHGLHPEHSLGLVPDLHCVLRTQAAFLLCKRLAQRVCYFEIVHVKLILFFCAQESVYQHLLVS